MITLTIILVTLVALYLYGIRTFNYWKKKGVKHDEPRFLFGTSADVFLLKKSISQMVEEMYYKYPDEKVVGVFRSTTPELIVKDPELVKRVLSTDFSYFYLRGVLPQTGLEPLTRHLFAVDGDLWRLLRQRLTAAFTSGKLKAMFPLIVERAEKLQERVLAITADGSPIDARDLMARYTTDFIGACGFGLESDSLTDENSPFRSLGKKIVQPSVTRIVKANLKVLAPTIFKNLKITSIFESEVVGLVRGILKQRNYKPSSRHDFIDLMLECQQKGIMTADSLEKKKPDGTPELAQMELTDELIAAQVVVFFVAGFETSSSTTSFTLHQLAYHPEIQRKVQEEIDCVLQQHDNKLSYDAIREMTYLDWTLKEGLRMFPSLGILVRKNAKPYTFPEINLSLNEGIRMMIPVQALHNDPKYFENPKEFRPERFNPEENDVTKYKYVYLPFGDGPRACIGERLGLMQSQAGLAAVLSRFTVEPAPTSLRHPIIEPKAFVQSFKGGLPLLFKPRKVST